MGAYLNTPETTKDYQNGEYAQLKVRYGAVEMQGWRNGQEDAHIQDKLTNGESVFGVFDGHGGREVARYVATVFSAELQKLSSYKAGKYEEALDSTFKRMDELLRTPDVIKKLKDFSNKDGTDAFHGMRPASQNIAMSTGCTSVVCLVTNDMIYCANAGDSRAVLSRNKKAIELSEDHKPDNPGEEARIKKAGGFVEEGRVKGILSLSRALGDLEYKTNKKLVDEEQMITCVPEITKYKREDTDDFLVIACDGIWDCLTSQQCVDLMLKKVAARKKNERNSLVVEDMFDEIIAKDIHSPDCDGTGTDNMTCIIVEFTK